MISVVVTLLTLTTAMSKTSNIPKGWPTYFFYETKYPKDKTFDLNFFHAEISESVSFFIIHLRQ